MAVSPPSHRRERQVVRLLALLRSLFQGERTSVQELAARFATRRETIYRDLRALEDAGYPIIGDAAGRLRHPRLMPESRTPVPELRLTKTEIGALLWAAKQAFPASPFAAALPAASAKLRAMAGREASTRAEEALTTWPSGEKDYSPHRETVLALVAAILLRERCQVTYRSPASHSTKRYTCDPYKLVIAGGALYCLGKVPRHGDIVTLAVDRIQSLASTGEIFEVDPAFDPDQYRAEAFGIVREKPMNVAIRFAATQAPYVRERQWHPTQQIRELPSGDIELRFRAGGAFEITRWILGWGAAAEVLAPRRLRSHLRRTLDEARALYRR
jgi:predicted DNA-binding transcriptional regulator YafY